MSLKIVIYGGGALGHVVASILSSNIKVFLHY